MSTFTKLQDLKGTGTGGLTISPSSTTAGTLLVIWVGTYAIANTFNTPTGFSPGPDAEFDSNFAGNHAMGQWFYYLSNPGGITSISLSRNGSATWGWGYVFREYAVSVGPAILDQHGSGTWQNINSPYTGVNTGGATTDASELVLEGCTLNSGTPAAGGAYNTANTQALTGGIGGIIGVADTVVSSTGTQTTSWTGGGGCTGGAQILTFKAQPSTTYTYTPSGGLTFAGAAAIAVLKTYTPTGGLSFGGTAAVSKGNNYTASGGLTFGGHAGAVTDTSGSHEYTPTGGLTFGGHAPATTTRYHAYIASGGITFGGIVGTHRHTRIYHASGGLLFGGSAATAGGAPYIYAGSGAIIFGGSATTYKVQVFTYAPSGGLLFGGTAAYVGPTGVHVYTYAPSGGLTFGGAATYAFQSITAPPNTFTYTASGGLTFGGAATTAQGVVQQFTLHGFADESVGVPTIDTDTNVSLVGFADEHLGTPTIAGAGSQEVTLTGFADEQIGTLGMAVDIQLTGFRDNGVADSSQDSPWAPEDALGLLVVSETAQLINLLGWTEDEFGTPMVLPADIFTNPPPAPGGTLVQQVLNPDLSGDGVHRYFDTLRNAVDPDAFDIIWTQRESDGTETFEFKLPVSYTDSSGNPVVRAELALGTAVTNPLNGVVYTVDSVDDSVDEEGKNYYRYECVAPHYALRWEPAIPFRTAAATDADGTDIDHGATLQEVLDCLNRAAANQGWQLQGSPCAAFAADDRCPFQENPSFDSTRASVLTQAYQASQLWGGRWRWDETARIGYLECDTGAGSGYEAHWRKNLKSVKRTRTLKPRQQVLVIEEQNGVMTGVTAQMMLAELESANACDDYLAQQALQNAQDQTQNGGIPADFDPCVSVASMTDVPGSLVSPGGSAGITIIQSDALKSARNYLYEAWLLEQVPQVSYEAGILDLSMIPDAAMPGTVTLGSWVSVIHDEAGISESVRCVGRAYNLIEPWKSTYELSNEIPWLSIVLPTAALKKPKTKAKTTTSQKGPLGPDTGFCLDNSYIDANWIPPPACVGQGVKLQIAYQDKLAQLQKLQDGQTTISVKLDQAITYLMQMEADARAQGVFLNLDSMINSLLKQKSEMQKAILEAQVQVLEAQQAIASATTIADNEEAANDSLKKCPEVPLSSGQVQKVIIYKPIDDWLGKEYGAWSDMRQASGALDKGHWEYAVRTFQYGDCNGDPLPSAPTPLGKGSGLDNATKSAADGACYYAKVTLPQVQADLAANGKTSTHISCGDITTTTTVVGGSGDQTPTIYKVFSLIKDMVDASVVLNKQWQKITETDALTEELRNNVKECVNKGLKGIFDTLARCEQEPTSQNDSGPGAAPFGTPVDTGGGYQIGGTTGVGGTSVGGSGGAASVTEPPRGGGYDARTCLDHTAAIAKSLLDLAAGLGSGTAGLSTGFNGIDSLRQAAGQLVTQTPPPPDDPSLPLDTPASEPPWLIDVADILAGVNDLRGAAANIGAAAQEILTAVQQSDVAQLQQLEAALSFQPELAANPNDPSNAELITAGVAARQSMEAARQTLNTGVCDAVQWNIVLQNDLQQLLANQTAIEDAIWAYGGVIADYGMDQTIQAQAMSALVGVPTYTSSLEDNVRFVASLALTVSQQVNALLDAVDCADSYMQLSGVDLAHQASTSQLSQNTWHAVTPNVEANPDAITVPLDYTDGHGAQTIYVQKADPALAGAVPKYSVWIQTPFDDAPGGSS